MIHGRNLIVSIDGTPRAGAKSCQFQISQEFLNVCSPTEGRTFGKVPTTYDWSMSVDCLIPNSSFSVSLVDKLIAGTRVLLTFTDGSGQKRAGFAYVKSCDESGSVGNLATFKSSFESDGELYKYSTQSVTKWQDHEGGFTIDPENPNKILFNRDHHYSIWGVQIIVSKPSKLLTDYADGLLAVYNASYNDIKNAITNNDQQYLDEKFKYYLDEEEDVVNLTAGTYTVLISAGYLETPSPIIKLLYPV